MKEADEATQQWKERDNMIKNLQDEIGQLETDYNKNFEQVKTLQ